MTDTLTSQDRMWSEFYQSKTLSFPDENLVRLFKGDYLQLPQNGRILDIGFGNGAFLEFAHEIGYTCWGSEVSDRAIEELNIRNQLKNREMELSKITQPTIEQENNFFDIVVSWNAIYYWADKSIIQKQLDEIFRVLRPGGVLLLSVISAKSSMADRLKPDTQKSGVYFISSAVDYDNRQGSSIFYASGEQWLEMLASFSDIKKGHVTLNLFREDKRSGWNLFAAIK